MIIGSSELMVDAKERFDYYKRLNEVRIKEIGLVQPETHYNEKRDLLIQRKIDGDILQRDNEVVPQLKKLYEERKILVKDKDIEYFENAIEHEIEGNYEKLYNYLLKLKTP